MVHETAENAGRDPAGPHGTQGWCYLVDPDAGDHREDPEEVPEGGLASGHKRKTGQNERLGMEGYKYAT